MQYTGAQILLHALINEHVKLIFGYPGGAIMPTYDALFDFQEAIKHVLVRHEQGAAHAAVGYARSTNTVGVCLATSGPGATNLVTGIADAMLDSVPLVCITGQTFSHLLGTDAFQEADVIGITVPITKWNYQITNAKEIPQVIHDAFNIAKSGKPGPVLIDITKDAQFETIKELNLLPQFNAHKLNQPLSLTQEQKQLHNAARLINQAKKPLLIIGQGVLLSQAQQELIAIAEKAHIPVGSTLLGLSAFPSKHPLYQGMLGMHGNYAINKLSNQADVVIAIGMRFDDRVTGNLSTYLKQSKIVHIDIDKTEINKNVKVNVSIHQDAKHALCQLLPLIKDNTHDAWLLKFKTLYAHEYTQVIAPETRPKHGDIKMAEVIRILSEITQGQAIVVSDVGQHQMITARYYQFAKPLSHISSGGLGTMGFCLPAAIGAQMGQPNRTVISISGDGGFQMNMQELAVIQQEQLPVKILILNNEFLGMVRQWQEMFFNKRYSFTQISSPDFIKIGQAYNIPSKRVTHRSQLTTVLSEFIASSSCYLLEIMVEKQDNVFPMVPSGASVDEVCLA